MHRAVVVDVTHGRVSGDGKQLRWLADNADGVKRLKVRYSVHKAVRHDSRFRLALGNYENLGTLDIAFGGSALALRSTLLLLESRLPQLHTLRLDRTLSYGGCSVSCNIFRQNGSSPEHGRGNGTPSCYMLRVGRI